MSSPTPDRDRKETASSTEGEAVMPSTEDTKQQEEEHGKDTDTDSKTPGPLTDSAYLTSNTLEGSLSSDDGVPSSQSQQRPRAAHGRGHRRKPRQKQSVEITNDHDDISDIVEDHVVDSSNELDSEDNASAAAAEVKMVSRSCSTEDNNKSERGDAERGDKSLSSLSFSSHKAARAKALSPARALLGRLPSPSPMEKEGRKKVREARESARMRYPQAALAVKLSKPPLSARSSQENTGFYRSNFVLSPRSPRKVVTWEEAMTARPPLRIDMDGPGPWSYSPVNKPLSETNSPMWSFGRRCFVEKSGGSRTSWEKSWFQGSDPWSQKVDFYTDNKWPAPTISRQRPVLGRKQPDLEDSPSFSIGVRRCFAIEKYRSEDEPSPNEYDKDKADDLILKRSPSYSHSFRQGGTVLWPSTDMSTPGPGAYNPGVRSVHLHRPAYTISGIRRQKSHELGPFATF